MKPQTDKPIVLRINHSAVFLPDKGLSRLPRAPKRRRTADFWARFEDKALFYDCFWHVGGKSVLLVGPPPLNLFEEYKNARFSAQPSRHSLKAHFSSSRSTMLTELLDVPPETTAIEIVFGSEVFVVPIQQNDSLHFKGCNLITTMNKNNDLMWIRQWLDWHVQIHGANAVVIFDNGSDDYALDELEKVLAAVDRMKVVCVVSWPYRYGPYDPGVIFHRHWANFLQMASLQMMHRRLGAMANAILNCDIDELVGRRNGAGAFETAQASPSGLVTLKGKWVELAAASQDRHCPNHLRYRYRSKSKLKSICANKWVLDPSRDWLEPLDVMPNVHRIYGIDKAEGRRAPSMPFWHFKAINTNWKASRRKSDENVTSREIRLHDLDREVETYVKIKKGLNATD